MAGWICPYCGQIATSTAITTSSSGYNILQDTKYGSVGFKSFLILCPNDDCKEVVLTASFDEVEALPGRFYEKEKLEEWTLRPSASIKVFPDYVPKPILKDYEEAAQIKDLSPKASATLSRRCLQGMIRDFWGVNFKTLFEEINAIKDKVDGSTWDAIDGVREIGNIGAHMQKDIDLIINVDPEEAELLIQLIEMLIKDWYVTRAERMERTSRIADLAAEKKATRKNTL